MWNRSRIWRASEHAPQNFLDDDCLTTLDRSAPF
jgi:hypothetical protein